MIPDRGLFFMEHFAECVPVSDEGYTYMVRCSASNEVKIGMTNGSLSKRMANYRTHLPGDLQIIAFASGAHTEQKLHKLFHKHRLHGEWFDLSDEDIATACTILDVNAFNAESRSAAVCNIAMSLCYPSKEPT